MEFNPDGSLKIPENMQKPDPKIKLDTEKCVHVRRDVIYDRSLKKCRLHVTFSKLMSPVLEKTFSETPAKINQITEKEFQVDIGTSFRRCSECNAFVKRLSEKSFGNIIEDKGTCTYQGRTQSFSYEDYFE